MAEPDRKPLSTLGRGSDWVNLWRKRDGDWTSFVGRIADDGAVEYQSGAERSIHNTVTHWSSLTPAPDQTNAEVSDERLRELLPCPFCGGPGEYQTDTEDEEFSEEWIGCTSCGATTALEVWNRRSVTSQASEGETKPKTSDEWSEEDGDVVWWCWRNGEWLGEPAYIGTPLDLGQTVEIELRSNQGEFVHQHQVGGWPGYHTHWTPHPTRPQALGDRS